MRDLKPLPDRDDDLRGENSPENGEGSPRDPARSKLAAAIALHAGAVRDWQVAQEAAELAERRHWQSLSALEELRKVVADPSALADEFISSVGAGNPCGTAVLERSGVAAAARISAAENDARVWQQTHDECAQVSRSKEAVALQAKSGVERAARVVVANSATAMRLMDELEKQQAEIIGKRVALQFIWSKGLNGELAQPDNEERMARLLNQNLGAGQHHHHPARGAWQAAFDELLTDPDAKLPIEKAA